MWSLPQIPPLVSGTSSGMSQSCHARCEPPTQGPSCLLHCDVRDKDYTEVGDKERANQSLSYFESLYKYNVALNGKMCSMLYIDFEILEDFT